MKYLQYRKGIGMVAFCTVMNTLKSPKNVGMIIRSHVAYGGVEVIFTGSELPWRFKKSTKAFSRMLEKICPVTHIKDPFETLNWCRENGYATVAVEIKEDPLFLGEFSFPSKCAIILGNEGTGLSADFLAACDYIVTIPQKGPVGSLNVAVAASIVMYESHRYSPYKNRIVLDRYDETETDPIQASRR